MTRVISFIAKRLLWTLIFPLIFSFGCGWEKPDDIEQAYNDLPEAIDFNYHVKPILSDKCFACHGPDAANQEADLRLDLEEFAFASLRVSSPASSFRFLGLGGNKISLL